MIRVFMCPVSIIGASRPPLQVSLLKTRFAPKLDLSMVGVRGDPRIDAAS
jgi:hypothetical protein